MKIAIVSKLWEKSDPYSTGGTGVLVGNLVEGLIKRGHKVTLFATGDTKTKAHLISVIKKPFSDQKPYSEIYEYLNIAKVFQEADKYDIINCHVECKSLIFSNITKTPVVHTLGYGEFFEDELNLLKKYKNQPFIAVSRAIADKFNFLNFKAIAYIGLNYNRFPFNDSPKNYFLFLARMSPQKGPHLAIAAAHATGVKLILAGKTSSSDKKYLKEKVFPYLDGKNIKYIGEVNFKKKIALLKNARALLHPHTCFEAFGISLLESQACGTPVIAYPGGAASEIIKNEQTGFIVSDESQMKKAIKNINIISRKECRINVEKNFILEKMVEKYEEVFKKLVRKEK